MSKTGKKRQGFVKKEKGINVVDDNDSSDNELYAGMISDLPLNSVNSDKDGWTVKAQINGKNVTLQIDTGAKCNCNVMSSQLYQSFGIKTALRKTTTPLTSFSGHKLKPEGTVQLPCKIEGKLFDTDFYIVNSSVPAILGATTCLQLGLIQRLYNIQSKVELKQLKDKVHEAP